MRMLKPLVLIAALAAAPAVHADPVCDAVNHAVKVGARGHQFAAFRRNVPAPAGFSCRIITQGDLGAYACSMPVEPEARIAKAKALIETVRACVRPSLIVEKSPDETNAMFIISRSPPGWVMVNGAAPGGAADATRITLYVVAYGSRSATRAPSEDRPLAGQGTGGPAGDSYAPWPVYDPRVETPHFPQPQR